MVFVDPEYRTGLGTGFYDRRAELDALGGYVEARWVTVVYGPRNVGKSELVRYWIRRVRGGKGVVSVDAAVLRSRGVTEGVEWYLAPRGDKARQVFLSGLEALGRRLGVLDVYNVAWRLYGLVEAGLGEVVLFIDEFHLLPGYRGAPEQGGYEEALADLEALSHVLSRSRGGVRVVLTVSEGFVATGEALRRLHGYNTGFLVVEHLDDEHFSELYREYGSVAGCSTSYALIRSVVGGAPGYLPELCRGMDRVAEFIERSKNILEEGLSTVRRELAALHGREVGPGEVIGLAYRLMGGERIRPLENPLLNLVGQLLTASNIVYPVYDNREGAIVYKPQIPVYYLLVEAAARHGYPSVLMVSTGEIVDGIEARRGGARQPA